MSSYSYTGPVDCSTPVDTTKLRGKTAIVTGGANGLGEAYVRALNAVGCHVIIADLNVSSGQQLAEGLPNAFFVRTDVTDWESQVSLFSQAIKLSPLGKIHYVIANAGMINKDDVFYAVEDEPTKPNLKTVEVNLIGTMYTTKLATHYFVKQNGTSASSQQEDTCLILIGSGAAFLDCNRQPQYNATKWGMRGIMHALRRTSYHYGSRVNVISPWYVRTSILSPAAFSAVEKLGIVLATVEEAQETLLRFLSDTRINGRSIFVSGKKYCKEGYIDLDLDDYHGYGGNELLLRIEHDQMLGGEPENGLYPDLKGSAGER